MQDYWIFELTNTITIDGKEYEFSGGFVCKYQPIYSNINSRIEGYKLLEYFPKRYFIYEKIINEIYYPNGFIGKKW